MTKLYRAIRRAHRGEAGITGLETAIILIAFVIVASVFAFVVLSTGLFSAERGKQTVLAGLEKASGNVELRGDVIAEDTNTDGDLQTADSDTLIFNMTLAASGRPVLLDPAATTNRVVINFVDTGARVADATYTVTWILAEATPDDLLEAGELAEITVTLPAGIDLDTNEEFSMEIVPPSGGTVIIARTIPPQVEDINNLH